ncbi:uncharacterized protein CANTADRAFT_4203 [Suhomyces tanzawaensis NRRL Y-17324]|uniref:F-box domain-containing protein n=1 Tax=Suhomyces tanzawaensis NRRL Y-17324 TaxID=984487 RepID=A0A1E4SRQ2_9ASCO|nr:uncharacterized protein CANTADRAFT_4203 [Suhomyces tanzawaensis NRRL Y-17324]ODV82175.1 hypothetical protein CANTADRAFT_4203 [Suhomyces tanzawaensis NRRL Y-17324]
MTSILHLPSEVIISIFQYLTPRETLALIKRLKLHQHEFRIKMIINLMYQRLFNGKVMIVNEVPKDKLLGDTLLTVSSFEEIFKVDCYENHLFKDIRPNSIEFKFTRQANDYSTFIHNLYEFNQLLEARNCGSDLVTAYLDKTLQMTFYADANLIMVENPTSLSAIMIKVLINLATHPAMAHKFDLVAIKSTDIGNIYVSQWGQLFAKFGNLHELDLSDNMIRNYYDDACDVLTKFKFPRGLKKLTLNNNQLTTVSREFIKALPPSLEELLLSNNRISEVCPGIVPFRVRGHLPKLRLLDLSFNYAPGIDLRMFCTTTDLDIDLRETGISREIAVRAAQALGFTLA